MKVLFFIRIHGLDFYIMFVTNMTGLEADVPMMSWKTIHSHGLTAGIKTLKPFKRLFWNLNSLQVSNRLSDSGKLK